MFLLQAILHTLSYCRCKRSRSYYAKLMFHLLQVILNRDKKTAIHYQILGVLVQKRQQDLKELTVKSSLLWEVAEPEQQVCSEILQCRI